MLALFFSISGAGQVQNLSNQVHRINISQPHRPGLKGSASQPNLPKYVAQNVKRGLAKEADLLAIQQKALAALMSRSESEDESEEDRDDNRSDEENQHRSKGQSQRQGSRMDGRQDVTSRPQSGMTRSRSMTQIQARRTHDISEDESEDMEEDYQFAAQDSGSAKKTPPPLAKKTPPPQPKPLSPTDSSSQGSWSEPEWRRDSAARNVSSGVATTKDPAGPLKTGTSVKSKPSAPTASVSESRSSMPTSARGHHAVGREGPKASSSPASNFSIASMVGESFNSVSNNGAPASRSSTTHNSSFFPGQSIAENTMRKESKKAEQEEPLADLSFGSMLGLLGGSDSPGPSGWSEVDTNTGTDVDSKGSLQAQQLQQQYPGSAFNKDLPYGGGQGVGYNDVPMHGGHQYPYGSSSAGQYPWSGSQNTHWSQQQMNSYGEAASGGYRKDSDQGFRNMGQTSSWGQQQQQPMIHSGMGYMGYPPQAHWGHHPYSQTPAPYTHQPPVFGHGQGSYPSWNYGQDFGTGTPRGGGHEPYGHEGS